MNKEKHRRKLKKRIIICLIAVFAISGVVYGWFLVSENTKAERENIDVMTPYFLYLLNPGDTNSLQFAVGNLHPGETKREIICVSNKTPSDVSGEYFDIARDSDFNYELELVQTNNLAVNYTLYGVERHMLEDGYTLKDDEFVVDDVPGYYFKKAGTALVGADESEKNRESIFGDNLSDSIVNKGTYTLYSKYSDNSKFHLSYEAANAQYDYNYFMIEINWDEDAEFIENSRETDLLYVIVNAMQLKPEEK